MVFFFICYSRKGAATTEGRIEANETDYRIVFSSIPGAYLKDFKGQNEPICFHGALLVRYFSFHGIDFPFLCRAAHIANVAFVNCFM